MTLTDSTIDRVRDILEADPNVVFAYAFGSSVRFPERRPRDLDVAVYYERPPEGLVLLDEIQRLSRGTGREVDLVVLNHASALLRHQVARYGRRLVCRDAAAHAAFRDRTIREAQRGQVLQ